MTTDAELLSRYARHHDESAFALLVDRHLTMVYNAALRRLNGNSHLAEEAAQAVFTQLALKSTALQRHPALVGWLFTSARFAASVIIRRETRRVHREQTAATMHPTPDHSAHEETIRPLLEDAMDQLSEPDRHAVVSRYYCGRTHAEVATELHISEEAARKRIDRAVARLRNILQRRGITTTSAALATVVGSTSLVAAPSGLAGHVTSTALTTASVGGASGTIFAGAWLFSVSSGFVATLSVVTVLSVTSALAAWADRQGREEAQLETLRMQAVAQHARLMQLQPTRPKPATATQPPRAAGGTATANALDARLVENLRAWERLAADPVYARVREREIRMRVQREFGAFLASRGYPAERSQFLRAALAKYYDAEERIEMGAQLAGISGPVDRTRVQADFEAEKQRLFSALTDVFSEPEIQDVRRCLETRQVHGAAQAITRDLGFHGTPLTPVQELALAMVIADGNALEWKNGPAERERFVQVDDITGLSRKDITLLDDAAAFLSPEQLRLLATNRRLENTRAAIVTRIRNEDATAKTAP